MTYETVLVERRGEVGVITLNRPDKLNSINLTLAHDLRDAVAELDGDDAIGAIVITGAGRAFSAGGDIGRIEGMGAAPPEQPSLPNLFWLEQLRAAKPTIAAINGLCYGAAFARILCCDVRIASTQATFCARFAQLGLGPEMALTQILPSIVGLQVAADLVMSARVIDGVEAERLGVVLKVVEPDQLLDAAVALGAEYAANPRRAVREMKRLLYANFLQNETTLVARAEGEVQTVLANTPEMLEAMAALKERRKPDFAAARAKGT